MTKEEFAQKLKKLHFTKVTGSDGSRGYTTTIDQNGKPYGITVYAAPEMKAKKALDWAWEHMLRRLAEEWGYTESLTAFE